MEKCKRDRHNDDIFNYGECLECKSNSKIIEAFEDKSELVFGKDKRRYRRKLERKIKGKKKFGFK